MNGRTCQLCGKPLSRIRVGTGGDFCSREHRNQYRLRCGMDRLLEANKMASLMRRRENLKPLPPLGSQHASEVQPRPYEDPLAWKVPPASGAANALPRLSPLLAGRMASGAGFRRVRPRPGARGVPRGEGLPRAAKPRRPQVQPLRSGRPSAMLRASAAVRSHRKPLAKGARRSYGVMLRKLSRPVLGAPGGRRIAPAQANFGAPPRPASPSSRKGTMLRVCAAAGFRIPARTLLPSRLESRATAAMAWPDRRRLALPRPRMALSPRTSTAPFPIAESIYPASRGLEHAVSLPGLKPVRAAAPQPAAAHRVGQAPFELHDPLWFRGPAGQEDDES